MKTCCNNRFIFTLIFSCLCLIGYSQSVEIGMASYYSDKFEGKKTASGELYKSSKMTAAHPTLPFGTLVKVTNLSNNKSVNVTVNDRGPFVKDRIIDLSKSAAVKLDYIDQGVAKVKVEPIK
jgi:rare lipoprotein A